MNSINSNEIRKKLSLKYSISLEELLLIVKSPFEVAAQTITEGDRETLTFKNIRIPNFGMFLVKDRRKQHFREYGYKTIRNRRQKQPVDISGGSDDQGVQSNMGEEQRQEKST